MLALHPALQLAAICLAVYTFLLGAARFRAAHLRHAVPFAWKRHALCGKISLVFMLGGLFGGMTMVYRAWQGFLVTGLHGRVALAILPLLLFGLGSGLLMDRQKKKRAVLPLLHGINNTVLLILTLSQIVTGISVYRTFVLGIY